MNYTIVQNFIPGLPTTPFRNGVGAYEGVVSHSTESANRWGGDTPDKERAYEAGTFDSAFVHFFVGVQDGAAYILQTADTNYISYHAGPSGNHRYIGVELCMYDDPNQFQMAYDAYVWLLAKLLYDKKLGVTPASSDGSGTCWSHKDISDLLGGSDHQDPIRHLADHSIAWSQHVANVQGVYNRMEAAVTGPFPDVPADSWCFPAIEELRQKGILYGDSTGLFHPDQQPTRGEIAVMLRRVLNYMAAHK